MLRFLNFRYSSISYRRSLRIEIPQDKQEITGKGKSETGRKMSGRRAIYSEKIVVKEINI